MICRYTLERRDALIESIELGVWVESSCWGRGGRGKKCGLPLPCMVAIILRASATDSPDGWTSEWSRDHNKVCSLHIISFRVPELDHKCWLGLHDKVVAEQDI